MLLRNIKGQDWLRHSSKRTKWKDLLYQILRKTHYEAMVTKKTCFSHRDTLTDQWYRIEDPRNTFTGIWTGGTADPCRKDRLFNKCC